VGALPKERISHQRQQNRRSHMNLSMKGLTNCPQCHTPRLPHTVCPVCGTYKGQTVVEVEKEDKNKK
jgi:large subunit ribosomal protein L32